MWRFLVHTLIQCVSNKSGGWDQFSTQLGCGIICLSKGLTYNFSKFVFDNMSENITRKKGKFLMYPRFVTMIIQARLPDLPVHAEARRSSFSKLRLKRCRCALGSVSVSVPCTSTDSKAAALEQ